MARRRTAVALATALLLAAAPMAQADDARQRYDELTASIWSFKEVFDEAAKTRGPASAQLLDQKKLQSLVTQAEQLAGKGQYVKAIPVLEEAYLLTETAVMRQRDNETVVYERGFQTAQDEVRFERKRFDDYLTLCRTIWPEVPADRRVALDTLITEAERERKFADSAMGRGDLPEVIRRLGIANDTLIKALNAAGLMVPG